jgi:hypothetical protein
MQNGATVGPVPTALMPRRPTETSPPALRPRGSDRLVPWAPWPTRLAWPGSAGGTAVGESSSSEAAAQLVCKSIAADGD